MDETPTPKSRRGWPKGKPRGPKKPKESAPMFTAAVETQAPINVRVTLRNGADPVTFGCSRRFVENGFHVFFYPSKTDPYRETRREFAISEIVEIEITEARQVSTTAPRIVYDTDPATLQRAQIVVEEARKTFGPQIHSVRKNATAVLSQLEQANGSIKMDTLPNLNIGGAPRPVTFGDSEA